MKKFLVFIPFIFITQFVFSYYTTYYVTVEGAGNKTGEDWDNALDVSGFITVLNSTVPVQEGNIYYIYKGTYNFTSSVNNSLSGVATGYIRIIGVSDLSIPPTTQWTTFGDDRPYFYFSGNYNFYMNGSYIETRNLIFNAYPNHNASPFVKLGGDFSLIYNVKITYNNPTTNCIACQVTGSGSGTTFIYCQISCPNGYAIYGTGSGSTWSRYFYNFIYNSKYGINTRNSGIIIGNIFKNITSIACFQNYGNDRSFIITNNIFYSDAVNKNMTGISLYEGGYININVFIYNNIFYGQYIGINATNCKRVVSDYNNFYNNTTDILDYYYGANDKFLDPQFEDPENNNFNITNPNFNNLGAPPPNFAGTNTNPKCDIGGIQFEPSEGGGIPGKIGSGYTR